MKMDVCIQCPVTSKEECLSHPGARRRCIRQLISLDCIYRSYPSCFHQLQVCQIMAKKPVSSYLKSSNHVSFQISHEPILRPRFSDDLSHDNTSLRLTLLLSKFLSGLNRLSAPSTTRLQCFKPSSCHSRSRSSLTAHSSCE